MKIHKDQLQHHQKQHIPSKEKFVQICHGQNASTSVTQVRSKLIFKILSPNRCSTISCICRITTLYLEYNTV
ncbi:unnamed protein product [Acanthoscelides obtectus]|uniref:Uncharacterized protein n=1 Tax=Acanthoscelides obtectus TaxID=200917 RepID=A0A9P0L746_ACAOB|nr:unnamed protein product [Acanthoscelides obtectus]CAK1623452.1 hypothetical protein AOBTE_LOCUS2010 [Acanthoscelides obtectus]